MSGSVNAVNVSNELDYDEHGQAQDMARYVLRSIYSKRLSQGQNQYGADVNLVY